MCRDTEHKLLIQAGKVTLLDLVKDSNYVTNHAILLNSFNFIGDENYQNAIEFILDYYTDLKSTFPSEVTIVVQCLKEGKLYNRTTWKKELLRKYVKIPLKI
jgi:hypothetical protein